MRRLRILTWASRPDYLRCLAQTPHELIVVSPGGREARGQKLDVILFQQPQHYLDDQYELLTPAQRRTPKVYLEHEPPREHPVDSRHVVTDANVVVVHVSHFNRLMWDHGQTPTRVIEPGVIPPAAAYSGELDRGLARSPSALALMTMRMSAAAVSGVGSEASAKYMYQTTRM